MTKRTTKTTGAVTQKLPAPIPENISSSDRMLMVIEKASTDTRCNVEKMRALLDMKMELVRDDRRIAYNNAMKAAQEEMKPILRKAANEKKKYAKLEHIDNMIRPIYSAHGFSLSFNSRKEADTTITMICDVLHSGGHHEQKELNAARDLSGAKGTANKTDIQAVGSTVSYLRRYLTCMVFNVTTIDDDDDGAGGKIAEGNTAGKKDVFSEKAAQQAGGVVIDQEKQPADPHARAIEAAEKLLITMRAAPTKERRGEILMKNMKVMKALDEADLHSIAKTIRTLAEEEVVINGK